MSKFKVGDIITGKPKNGYGYTNNNNIMVVVRANKNCLSVKIINGKNVKSVGHIVFDGLSIGAFVHYDETPFEGNV